MIFGFKDDKSKEEVYSKNEVYSKDEVYTKDEIDSLKGLFIIHGTTAQKRIAAGGVETFNVNLNIPTGYIALAITGAVTSNNHTVLRGFELLSDGTASFIVRNVINEATPTMVDYTVICVKGALFPVD